MITSSADLLVNFGWRSTGIPRPLSRTRQDVARLQFDFDARRVAGDRFVHRVVENFGREMVQRAFIGAADIHAGAAPHRLEALKDLDVLRGVAAAGLRRVSSNPGSVAPVLQTDRESSPCSHLNFARTRNERGRESAPP